MHTHQPVDPPHISFIVKNISHIIIVFLRMHGMGHLSCYTMKIWTPKNPLGSWDFMKKISLIDIVLNEVNKGMTLMISLETMDQ